MKDTRKPLEHRISSTLAEQQQTKGTVVLTVEEPLRYEERYRDGDTGYIWPCGCDQHIGGDINYCAAHRTNVAPIEARRPAEPDGWRDTETMPESGQVIVCWSDDTFDTIGRGEYLEIMGYGETPAKGWMPLPPPPSSLPTPDKD